VADKGVYANVDGAWKFIEVVYINVGGSWFEAYAGWNDAEGGTVTEVDDYNGTGQKWRVHTFSSNGTFTVKTANKPFSVLFVGGGGSGGQGCHYYSCGGRGGSGGKHDAPLSLPLGSYTVKRGGGGAGVPGCGIGGSCACASGRGGGTSSITDSGGVVLASAGGGPGGQGGPGGTGNNAPNRPNYTYVSNITGSGDKNYGNNGGSGSCDYGGSSGGGGAGVAIIAYQIG